MSSKILDKIVELYEKHDILTQLGAVDILKDCRYSNIHCIDAIGRIKNPNVTKIAKELNMTKGAISKITKKQMASGLISSYTLDDNKKIVCFKLTDKGNELFHEHEKIHKNWEKSQEAFLEKQPKETLEKVEEFLESFNNFLKEEIEKVGEERDKYYDN